MKNYIVNYQSKEIHRKKYINSMCGFKKKYLYPEISWFKAMWLILFNDFDGCSHCWPKLHVK